MNALQQFFGKLTALHWALGFSVLAHGALLTVRFVDPEGFNRVFQDTPLEVILVNAKSHEAPDKAQAIAQANLAGGGDADQGRATTPLPYAALTEAGDSPEQTQHKIESLQEQQMLMLAQIKKQLAAIPAKPPAQVSKTPEAQAREDRRRQLLQLLAEIERRINEENARPKKRYISPATREAVYATYYDNLRRKIEDKGTESFPEAAGQKLYGELTMALTVNHDGRVVEVEVVQPSGNFTLDRRAKTIAQTAGPFGSFSPSMRQRADQLVVVARFRFTRDATLQTSVSSQAAYPLQGSGAAAPP